MLFLARQLGEGVKILEVAVARDRALTHLLFRRAPQQRTPWPQPANKPPVFC